MPSRLRCTDAHAVAIIAACRRAAVVGAFVAAGGRRTIFGRLALGTGVWWARQHTRAIDTGVAGASGRTASDAVRRRLTAIYELLTFDVLAALRQTCQA